GAHTATPILTGSVQNLTTYGAVVAKLKGHSGDMPPYVHLGGKLFNSRGVVGGALGTAYDPVEVPDPPGTKVELPQFVLAADVSPERFRQRCELLDSVDRMRAAAETSAAVEKLDALHHRAVGMLTSPTVREAFDLSREKETARARYGGNFFGQSLLM